ncbi:hypothetical protein HDV01_005020 [Terramyces sp. JEL0728]|nr:hypothetical protein HDV01_005020 [Terramyces sp. JEL0728]
MSTKIPKKVSKRSGNWCEETEMLKEFLAKMENGEGESSKQDIRLSLANSRVNEVNVDGNFKGITI